MIVALKQVPMYAIGHWKKLHSKVSQGGAGGARINIFSKADKNLIQMLSIII